MHLHTIHMYLRARVHAGVIDISKYAMADRSQLAGTNDSTAYTLLEYTHVLATRLDVPA